MPTQRYSTAETIHKLRDLETENSLLSKAVALVRAKHRHSERRICRVLGICRSMVRHVPQPPVDGAERPATIANRLGGSGRPPGPKAVSANGSTRLIGETSRWTR